MTDSREIAQHDGRSRQEVQTAPGATMIPIADRLAMMREALTNPDVNPDKARAMFALMRDVERDQQQAEFNRSKIAAMREMPAIYKRGLNSHLNTRYAKFEDLHRAIMPVLARHNLTLEFRVGSEGRDVTVQPIVRHDNGHVDEGGVMRSPPVEGKGLNIAQSQAIALAYLKRHAFKATFNIIEDDEDQDGGPPRDGDLLNDRQQRLLIEAQEAADAGEYAGWFARQTVKDKALMVTTGNHARFGGAKMLPGVDRNAVEDRPRQDPPRQDRPTDGPDVTTPEGWTEQYCIDVANAEDGDALQRLFARKTKALQSLKEGHPKLWERCDDARIAKQESFFGGNS